MHFCGLKVWALGGTERPKGETGLKKGSKQEAEEDEKSEPEREEEEEEDSDAEEGKGKGGKKGKWW